MAVVVNQSVCPVCEGQGFTYNTLMEMSLWCDPCAGHGWVSSTDVDYNQTKETA